MIICPPAFAVRSYLIDLGIVALPGNPPTDDWSCWVSNLPNVPDQAVSIRDSTAQNDGSSMQSGEVWQHEIVAIRIRGLDYAACWAKGIEIQEALSQVNATVIGTQYGIVRIPRFTRTTSLTPIGTEESKDRYNFVINGKAPLEEV